MKKWPFDKSTTIALFALLLSLIQFFLNTPLLVNFYIKPDLVMTGNSTYPKNSMLLGAFQLENQGRASATNIEIGLLAQEDQKISIIPNIEAEIIEEKNPIFVKNVRIKIPKLLAGEFIIIMVRPSAKNEKLNDKIADFYIRSMIKAIPMINFIKSDQGMGKNNTNPIGFEDDNKSIDE